MTTWMSRAAMRFGEGAGVVLRRVAGREGLSRGGSFEGGRMVLSEVFVLLFSINHPLTEEDNRCCEEDCEEEEEEEEEWVKGDLESEAPRRRERWKKERGEDGGLILTRLVENHPTPVKELDRNAVQLAASGSKDDEGDGDGMVEEEMSSLWCFKSGIIPNGSTNKERVMMEQTAIRR